MRGLGLGVVLAAMVGCGGDGGPDVSGFFETTLHTRNDSGCGDGPAVTDPPYFEVEKQDFLGQNLYVYGECTSGDVASCSNFGFLGISFQQQSGDGWVGNIESSSASGGNCTLRHLASSAMPGDGDTLRIEVTTWGEEIADGPDCTAEEAGARGETMPCLTHEVIEGTRIGDAVVDSQ